MARVVTGEAAFEEAVQTAPPGARVPVEIRCRVADPFQAYRRARNGTGPDDREWGFYLATTGGQSGWGYFGVDPVERLQVGPEAAVRQSGDRNSDSATHDSPSLAALEGLLDDETLVRGECDVPFPCGAFGWLSYDVSRELEDFPEDAEDDRGLPRLQVAVYDAVVAWEEPRGDEVTLRVTACPRVDADGDRGLDPETAYDQGVARTRELAKRAVEGDPRVGSPPVPSDRVEFESEAERTQYAERVEQVKRYVRDGDTFQANVSHRLVAPAAVHPVEAFDAVRTANPAPYSALLEFPGVDLVSASPELLLSVDGDRVATEPIAGTRPRGDTPAADEEFEAGLRSDQKEAAEHAMLVDLERNDLGKVCEFGSVEVSEYRGVDRYAEVMHLVSMVEGTLRDDASTMDAVAALFPGGTITGAPKPRTMEIIDELEATRRGPYTGSIGAFGFDGRATLNIVIRTLVRYADEYHLRVGAGVVDDSDPEREYDETLDKARALITALEDVTERDLAVEVRR
ncbi:aminodeoxychorismate synthase, component I [Halobacteriales archaeon QS_1_68_20]|nr:MAG: aminodeoxychorismate synthase, component I [Halobacteriales archaeon QS_1_68_20]